MKLAMGLWKLPSKKVMHYAIEQGIRFFDTAYTYNGGRSEKRLGEVEKESGVPLFIASKIPPINMQWPVKDGLRFKDVYPKKWVKKIVQRSLKHLDRDYINLMQFHVWNDAWVDDIDDVIDAVSQINNVSKWGICVGDGVKSSVENGFWDYVQIAFGSNTYCKFSNIKVLVYNVFNNGNGGNLDTLLRSNWLDWPIDKVIVGMRTIEHLKENIECALKAKS